MASTFLRHRKASNSTDSSSNEPTLLNTPSHKETMEYSSTKKMRLPGISTLLDDVESSYDSHEYREDATPVKYDGFQRYGGSTSVIGGGNYSASSATAARNTPGNENYETPRQSTGSAVKTRKSTGKSRRSTFSPTSANLNNVLHATAEAIVANTQAESLGERIVERLDDFAEGVLGFMGGKEDGVASDVMQKVQEQSEENKSNGINGAASSEVDCRTDHDLAAQSFTAADDTEHGNTTVDDSATNHFSPDELAELNNSADLNTTNDSEESGFYIGYGEDGFCSSQSIHDSEISSYASDSDGCQETLNEELDETFESRGERIVERLEVGEASGNIVQDPQEQHEEKEDARDETVRSEVNYDSEHDLAVQSIAAAERTEDNNLEDLDTTNDSEESGFYIGCGEDGFCPSQSIHDSEISSYTSDSDSYDKLEETFESKEGEEVNMSILTEYENESQRESIAEIARNTSTLTEIVCGEKKIEPVYELETGLCDDTAETELNNSPVEAVEADGLYRRKPTNEAYHCSTSTSPPTPAQNLGMSPRATPYINDSSISEDAFVSSSFKQFLNHQASNLNSLLSSIEGITATPSRIEDLVQNGMYDEDDSDDEKMGLTPLKSRLESIQLDRGEKLGTKLFSSPLEEDAGLNGANQGVEQSSGDEHRCDVLRHSSSVVQETNSSVHIEPVSSLNQSHYPEIDQSTESIKTPLNESQQSNASELKASSNESFLSLEERGKPAASVGSILEVCSNEAAVSLEESYSGLIQADLLSRRVQNSAVLAANHDLSQSPLSEQVDLLTATTSLVEASPFETASSAEILSNSPSASMEYLRQSTNKEKCQASEQTSFSTSLPPTVTLENEHFDEKEDVEDSEIPDAFREMFAQAESIMQKEFLSPYLHSNTQVNIANYGGTFCDDYIKPTPGAKSLGSAPPSNNSRMPFASPTECVPLDTANLNKTNAFEAETTVINLDSLKEVFLKAEFQLESAETPEEVDLGQYSQADTTFDTANFSMSGLMAAADEFFDANDEFVDATHEEASSVNNKNVELSTKENGSDDVLEKDGEEFFDTSTCKKATVENQLEMSTEFKNLESDVEKNEGVFSDTSEGTQQVKSTCLSRNSSSAADSDSTVDITQTLDRVGEYLQRMTTQEPGSDDVSYTSPHATEADKQDCEAPSVAVDTLADLAEASHTDDPTPLACNTTTFSCLHFDSMNKKTQPEESNPAVDEAIKNEEKDQSNTTTLQSIPPDISTSEVNINTNSPHRAADSTRDNDVSSSLEASGRSDDMDESMFMPNTSMENSLIASPAPTVNNKPEPPLQTTSEDDEDSNDVSDEEFFPNRDLTLKAQSKVVPTPACIEKTTANVATKSVTNPPTRLRSSSIGRDDKNAKNSSTASQASRRSQPNMSKKVSTTTLTRMSQNSRKTVAPKTPQSSHKPAQKRTKLSTITNTVDSPKRAAASLKPDPAENTSQNETRQKGQKKLRARAAPRVARSVSQQIHSKETDRNEVKLAGISPRTSSMRRSLVAVAKSQRQSGIPKPKPSSRNIVSRSERLAQLAKPRSVVKKEVTQEKKTATQKKLTAAMPPSFLNRERKKSTVKSTEEREAEELSSMKPFKAGRIKGSSMIVRSRFNTPRAPTPMSKQTQSDGKPFRSLRESVDNYNFREQPPVATSLNPRKMLSAPSFVQKESSVLSSKENVSTLGESLTKYDFRAAPASQTPIDPNKVKPPSFLSRPSPAASYNQVKSSEELELEECKQQFKACPLPVSSVTRRLRISRPASRSRPREGRCLTTPRPPKLHTSARQMKTPIITQDDVELQRQFHARPLPASVYGTSTPMRYFGKVPQPSEDEIELNKPFQALALPPEIYGRSVGNDDTPFHIRASEQYERQMERKKQLIEYEMEQLRRSRERKATPLPPTNWEARPIRIKKSQKELVHPRPPRLSLDARSKEREYFDNQVQLKQVAEAAAEAARREEESRAEEQEVRRRRSLAIEEGGLCFRARPVSIKYE